MLSALSPVVSEEADLGNETEGDRSLPAGPTGVT